MAIRFKMNESKNFASKGWFFDRERVVKAVGRMRARVLSRFGAFVRTRAQSSILRHVLRRGFGVKSKTKNREGTSDPGDPPFSHTGLLVKYISFQYDPSTKSVVIGPELLNTTGTAPRALEYGGASLVKRGRKKNQRIEKIMIRARPYMRPAFWHEIGQSLPKLLPNSVRAA